MPRETRILAYSLLPGRFAISRLPGNDPIPAWAMARGFCSITRTLEELSIVCPADNVPPGVKTDAAWICMKLSGPFPFSEAGVLASFISPLVQNKIPIFAISTFDTDYVLVKEESAAQANAALKEAGHQLACA